MAYIIGPVRTEAAARDGIEILVVGLIGGLFNPDNLSRPSHFDCTRINAMVITIAMAFAVVYGGADGLYAGLIQLHSRPVMAIRLFNVVLSAAARGMVTAATGSLNGTAMIKEIIALHCLPSLLNPWSSPSFFLISTSTFFGLNSGYGNQQSTLSAHFRIGPVVVYFIAGVLKVLVTQEGRGPQMSNNRIAIAISWCHHGSGSVYSFITVYAPRSDSYCGCPGVSRACGAAARPLAAIFKASGTV